MLIPHLSVRTLLSAACRPCHQWSRRQLSQAVNGGVLWKCPTASAACDLGPVIIKLNLQFERFVRNCRSERRCRIFHINCWPSTCHLSAMHASRSLSSRTFNSSMYCISSSLAFLIISRFNGNPVLLSLNSWATSALSGSDSNSCSSTVGPASTARIPRLACSVGKDAVSLPPTVGDSFHKLSLCHCGLASRSHVSRTVNRNRSEQILIASNTAHAINSPRTSSSVRGLCIATEQYSSLSVTAVALFLGGFDHMEVDEQDREQVDSEREKVEARERQRKKTKQGNNKRSNMWWHVHEWYFVRHTLRHLEPQCVVCTRSNMSRKTIVWGVSVYTHRRLQWIAIDCKRNQL